MYRTQSSRQRAYGLQDCMVDYLEVQFDSEEKPERFCGAQEGRELKKCIFPIQWVIKMPNNVSHFRGIFREIFDRRCW